MSDYTLQRSRVVVTVDLELTPSLDVIRELAGEWFKDWRPRHVQVHRAAPAPSSYDEAVTASEVRCHGAGEIAVPIERDEDSAVWHVEFEPCPGCPDCNVNERSEP